MTRPKARSFTRLRIPWVRGLLTAFILLVGAVWGLLSPSAAGIFSQEVQRVIYAAGLAVGMLELFFLLGLRRFSLAKPGLLLCLGLEGVYFLGISIGLFFLPLPLQLMLLSLAAGAVMLLLVKYVNPRQLSA